MLVERRFPNLCKFDIPCSAFLRDHWEQPGGNYVSYKLQVTVNILGYDADISEKFQWLSLLENIRLFVSSRLEIEGKYLAESGLELSSKLRKKGK